MIAMIGNSANSSLDRLAVMRIKFPRLKTELSKIREHFSKVNNTLVIYPRFYNTTKATRHARVFQKNREFLGECL